MLFFGVSPGAMVFNDKADVGPIPQHSQLYGLDYRPLYVDYCHLYYIRTHPLYNAKPPPQLLGQVLSSKVPLTMGQRHLEYRSRHFYCANMNRICYIIHSWASQGGR